MSLLLYRRAEHEKHQGLAGWVVVTSDSREVGESCKCEHDSLPGLCKLQACHPTHPYAPVQREVVELGEGGDGGRQRADLVAVQVQALQLGESANL